MLIHSLLFVMAWSSSREQGLLTFFYFFVVVVALIWFAYLVIWSEIFRTVWYLMFGYIFEWYDIFGFVFVFFILYVVFSVLGAIALGLGMVADEKSPATESRHNESSLQGTKKGTKNIKLQWRKPDSPFHSSKLCKFCGGKHNLISYCKRQSAVKIPTK